MAGDADAGECIDMGIIANRPTADEMALELAADRIANLEHDLVAYRQVLQIAIHQLHALTKQNDRLREELRERHNCSGPLQEAA